MVAKKKQQKRKVLSGTVMGSLRSFLDGSLLLKDVVLKQLPFLFYLAVLAIILIANRYHAEKVFVKTEQVEKEIRELRSEKISVQSELMNKSRQHEVLKQLKACGSDLEISDEPPYKIVAIEE